MLFHEVDHQTTSQTHELFLTHPVFFQVDTSDPLRQTLRNINLATTLARALLQSLYNRKQRHPP